MRRRRSRFASEIDDFAKSFHAGWRMMDGVVRPRRSERLSPTEERRRRDEGEMERYQNDAEREAVGRRPARDGGNPGSGSELSRAGGAIGGIESSHRWDAVGPKTRNGDRAYGYYQVMGNNVGPWTQKYYGERLSPQEFLKNRDAQQAVFDGEFGRLKAKHGRDGAARAWFAGEGGMRDDNRRDVLGTSVRGYADKFNKRFNASSGDGSGEGALDGVTREGNPDGESGQFALQEPEQTAELEQPAEPESDFGDEFGDEFGDGMEETVFAAAGGAVPAAGWNTMAPDRRGAVFQRFNGQRRPSRPAVTPVLPVDGEGAAAPRVRAGERLRQMRSDRSTRDEQARRDAEAARAAAANAGFYKFDDENAFANRVWGLNARESLSSQPTFTQHNLGYSSEGGDNMRAERVNNPFIEEIRGAHDRFGGLRTDPTGSYLIRPPGANAPKEQQEEYRRLPRARGERDLRVPQQWFADGGYVEYLDEEPASDEFVPEDGREDESRYAEPYQPGPSGALDVDPVDRTEAQPFANPQPARSTRGGFRQEGGDEDTPGYSPAPDPRDRTAGFRQEGGTEDTPPHSPAVPAGREKGERAPTPPRRPREGGAPRGGGERRPGPPTRLNNGPAAGEARQQSDGAQFYGSESPTQFLMNEAAANGPGDAVRAGMGWIQRAFGFDAGAVNPGPSDLRRQERLRAFATNAEAPTMEEVRQIDRTIDPDGKLQPHQRSLARLYGMYRYWEDRGEPEKAAKTAGAMLLHVKRNAQIYGADILDRLQRGDAQGAAKAAEAGYAQHPDGKRVEVKPDKGGFQFRMFDDNGEITQEGKLTVNEMMRVATGLQDGTQWFQSMGFLASQQGRQARGAQGGRGQPSERSPRAPAPPRLSEGERREQADQQRRTTADQQRAAAVDTAAKRQMESVDQQADMASGEGIRARAANRQAIQSSADQVKQLQQNVSRADEEFRRAVPRANVPKADQDEVRTGASAVFGTAADGKKEADPFGKVPEAQRSAVATVVSRAAARAVMAGSGLTSDAAGRIVAEIIAKGPEFRADGTVAPRGDGRGVGVYLDRQSLEDIARLRKGQPSAPQQPAQQTAPRPAQRSGAAAQPAPPVASGGPSPMAKAFRPAWQSYADRALGQQAGKAIADAAKER